MSQKSPTQYKFIVDTMLGRLARWLSLLGYDVVYTGIIDDEELVRQAIASQRIILTRDTRLKKSHSDVSIFVLKATNRWEQLREVIRQFPLNFSETAFSRCQHCNVETILVDKKEVLDRLPPFVRQRQEKIYQCPRCKKLYWEASHVDHIKSLLKQNLNIDL